VYEGIQCRSVNLLVQVREGEEAFVRPEQNRSNRERKRERMCACVCVFERERNSRDSSARVRHEGWVG